MNTKSVTAGKPVKFDLATEKDDAYKNNADVLKVAAYSCDATLAFVEATKKAGLSKPSKYLPQSTDIHYKDVTGLIALIDKGDLKNAAVTLYTDKNGIWEKSASPGDVILKL